MAIDYIKMLQTAVSICYLFSMVHHKGATALINITAPINLNISLTIGLDIGTFLNLWLLLQGIISPLLP